MQQRNLSDRMPPYHRQFGHNKFIVQHIMAPRERCERWRGEGPRPGMHSHWYLQWLVRAAASQNTVEMEHFSHMNFCQGQKHLVVSNKIRFAPDNAKLHFFLPLFATAWFCVTIPSQVAEKHVHIMINFCANPCSCETAFVNCLHRDNLPCLFWRCCEHSDQCIPSLPIPMVIKAKWKS